MRVRFINGLVENKFLEIIFVNTKMNDADIMTKNLGGELYETHSGKLVYAVDIVDENESVIE